MKKNPERDLSSYEKLLKKRTNYLEWITSGRRYYWYRGRKAGYDYLPSPVEGYKKNGETYVLPFYFNKMSSVLNWAEGKKDKK